MYSVLMYIVTWLIFRNIWKRSANLGNNCSTSSCVYTQYNYLVITFLDKLTGREKAHAEEGNEEAESRVDVNSHILLKL